MPDKIVTHAENLLKSDDNPVNQWVQLTHEEEFPENHASFSVKTGAVRPNKCIISMKIKENLEKLGVPTLHIRLKLDSVHPRNDFKAIGKEVNS